VVVLDEPMHFADENARASRWKYPHVLVAPDFLKSLLTLFPECRLFRRGIRTHRALDKLRDSTTSMALARLCVASWMTCLTTARFHRIKTTRAR